MSFACPNMYKTSQQTNAKKIKVKNRIWLIGYVKHKTRVHVLYFILLVYSDFPFSLEKIKGHKVK